MHSVMVISSMGHWTRWAEKSCKRRKSWQPFPSNGLRQIERRENSTNVLFHYGDRKLSSYEIKSNEIFNDDNSIKTNQNSSNFHPSWIFSNTNSKTMRLSVVGELANQTTRRTRFIAQRWTYCSSITTKAHGINAIDQLLLVNVWYLSFVLSDMR